jgi:protein-disulfide isomerase
MKGARKRPSGRPKRVKVRLFDRNSPRFDLKAIGFAAFRQFGDTPGSIMEDRLKRLLQTATLLAALVIGGFSTASAQDKPWAIDEVMGKADAPITIVEYSSLTCPHCAKFHKETFPKVKSEWIDTGKAKLIFRDLPWDALAQATAMISHCSGDRYFAFIDTFFRTQDQWARNPQPLAAIKTIAKLGGMGEEQVDKCIADSGLLNEINARKDDGMKRYNVDSTPSFIINGKLASGDMSYDEFSKLLADAKK